MLKVSLESKRVCLLYPISEKLQYGGEKGLLHSNSIRDWTHQKRRSPLVEREGH